MLIRDLEFINLSDVRSGGSAIKGGAIAYTNAHVNIHNNNHDDNSISINADAGAVAVGDYSNTDTDTGATLYNNKHYTAGYGYAKGVATARTGSHYAHSVSYDVKIVH